MRLLEQAAVAAAGGANHRLGLHDMVMVKDNHLAARASLELLQASISRVKSERPQIRVELEADTIDQVRQFLDLEGVDVILLDNMPLSQLREAVSLRKPGIAFEASGGVTLQSVRQIAETGVDLISVGELTHSARAVDLSLEFPPTHLSARRTCGRRKYDNFTDVQENCRCRYDCRRERFARAGGGTGAGDGSGVALR